MRIAVVCWSYAQCFLTICRISLLGCLTSEIGKSGIAWKLKSTFKWGMLSISDELHLVNIEVSSIQLSKKKSSSILWISEAHNSTWFSLSFPSEIYIICGCTEHLTNCIGALVLPLISKILLIWIHLSHTMRYLEWQKSNSKGKHGKETNIPWILSYSESCLNDCR